MSGASEAIQALRKAVDGAYTQVYETGGRFNRSVMSVSHGSDLMECLQAMIDVVVFAEGLRDAAEAAVKSTRGALSSVMNDTGCTQVTAPHFTAHLSRKPAVLTVNEAELPPHFIVQRPTVDRAAIKSAIKDGVEVAGASMLQPNEMSLVLRARKEPTQ